MDGFSATSHDVRTIRVIWLAMLGSIGFYGIIAFIAISTRAESLQAAFSNTAVLALHLIAFGMLLMAFLIPSLMMKQRAEASPSRHPQPPLQGALRRGLRQALIIRFALVESVAVFGLLAAILGEDPRLFLPLGLVAAAGMLFSYPGQGVRAGIED